MTRSFLFFVLLLAAFPAFADEEAALDIPIRITSYQVEYKLNDDGTHVETRRQAMKVLDESALEDEKSITLSHSTSVQKIEVIEAYTEKADGKKIPVPKDNYQIEVNSGKDAGGPAFSDETLVTVIFPDLAVGDSTVLAYKLTQTEPIFPGHFSQAEVFPRLAAYDDVKVVFDVPSKVNIQRDVRQMTEATAQNGDRTIYTLAFQNKTPEKSKRRDYSVYDIEKDPGFTFSTFRDYRQIAEAYGSRAREKAAVTPRIQELADQIAPGKEGELKQAGLLHDWVAKNITYAGNCIGVGTVVPRNLDFVLDNKMGDCKDHATLFQALLAAKGIPSTQALINASSSFKLAKVPDVSAINHVINYIPSLNMFADTTARFIPWGMLPYSLYGKPVLLVDNFQDGFKTPLPPIDLNRQRSVADVQIHPDGSADVQVEVSYQGMWGAVSRAQFKNVPKEYEERLIPDMLKRMGMRGSGTLERDDTSQLSDKFHLKGKFKVEQFITPTGAGGLSIYIPFQTQASINHFVRNTDVEETADITCSAGNSVEEFTYHFPKGRQILSVPTSFTDSIDVATYKSTYKLKNSVLTVRREFDDRTPGVVCSPDYSRKFQNFIVLLQPKVKEQVLYK